MRHVLGIVVSSLALAACGSGNQQQNTGGASGTGGHAGGAGGASSSSSSSASSSSGSGGTGGSGGGTAAICAPPITPVDTATPATVVGSGPGTCTGAAFASAAKNGGVITFNCGGPATIPVDAQIELPKDKDTTIDGGGVITLDGGGKTRIFHFDGGDFRKTKTTVTLQHLTITHAKATGTAIPSAPPPCSQGFNVDGGGAGILIRDGVLHVIDVTFQDNHAASPGPDVAGGGVYAIGSLDVTIVGSRFLGNSASNGGAVGSLFSNLTLANDTFDHNQATGTGANYIDSKCTVNGGESGDGGNGGAVVMDGGETFDVSICGCTFTGNTAGALGGGVFRTPDLGVAPTHIDRCTFDKNQAQGGGAMYFHHSDLSIVATTLSNNTAEGAGGIKADDTQLTMTNTTLAGNSATKGLGGAMAMFGNGGTITNCTFASNHADGGSGLFGAAIAGGTTFTIDNSVFANNTSMDCGAPMACHDGNSAGQAVVQWPDKHLVCSSADKACAAGGTTFADPQLGTLGDNGGPTLTIAPAKGGPADGIGKGCPATDQRGKPRKTPDGCTAGAFEIE
ncbi:MAG: choice-of-anchor Q domain-containing protein [Minicystis sp.]